MIDTFEYAQTALLVRQEYEFTPMVGNGICWSWSPPSAENRSLEFVRSIHKRTDAWIRFIDERIGGVSKGVDAGTPVAPPRMRPHDTSHKVEDSCHAPDHTTPERRQVRLVFQPQVIGFTIENCDWLETQEIASP